MLNNKQAIIVVDDDPLSLRMLQRLLERKFKVFTASDGERALQLLEKEPICLILTDQQMPQMSGIELLQKSRLIDENIIRMLVTADRDSKTFIDALKQAGAVRVINKPWDPEKLMKTVCEALERYTVRAKNRLAFSDLNRANEKLKQVCKRPMRPGV